MAHNFNWKYCFSYSHINPLFLLRTPHKLYVHILKTNLFCLNVQINFIISAIAWGKVEKFSMLAIFRATGPYWLLQGKPSPIITCALKMMKREFLLVSENWSYILIYTSVLLSSWKHKKQLSCLRLYISLKNFTSTHRNIFPHCNWIISQCSYQMYYILYILHIMYPIMN